MIPVTIAVLLFGAAVFGIGLLAAKALYGARARVPQPERKDMRELANSRISG
jgi:hypothetical protein